MGGRKGTEKVHKNEKGNQNIVLIQTGKYAYACRDAHGNNAVAFSGLHVVFIRTETDLWVPKWENVCDTFVDWREIFPRVAEQ